MLKDVDLDKLKTELQSGQVQKAKVAEIRAVYDAFGSSIENRIIYELYSRNLAKLLKTV